MVGLLSNENNSLQIMALPSTSSMAWGKSYDYLKLNFLFCRKDHRGSTYIMHVNVHYKPLYKFQLLMTNLVHPESEKLSAGFSKSLVFLCSQCLRQKRSSVLLNMKTSIFCFRINVQTYLTTSLMKNVGISNSFWL